MRWQFFRGRDLLMAHACAHTQSCHDLQALAHTKRYLGVYIYTMFGWPRCALHASARGCALVYASLAGGTAGGRDLEDSTAWHVAIATASVVVQYKLRARRYFLRSGDLAQQPQLCFELRLCSLSCGKYASDCIGVANTSILFRGMISAIIK